MSVKATACLLPGLGDPRLGGAAPGLDFGAPFGADPRHFLCCGGRGSRLDPTSDVTHACALGPRLRETRRLAALYARLNGDESTAGFIRVVTAPVWLTPVLERLHALSIGRAKKGLALLVPPTGAVAGDGDKAASGGRPAASATARRVSGDGDRRAPDAGTQAQTAASASGRRESAAVASGGRSGASATLPRGGETAGAGRLIAPEPPSVWTVALAAAWRFALRPHVVVLGKTAAGELLPRLTVDAPSLLCVGGADALWDARTADQLDALVGYAYATMTPLFLQLVVRQDRAKGAPGSVPSVTSKAFARRLDAVRARSPLAWLPDACMVKLLDVTDGLEPLVRAAERERAAVAPRPRSPSVPRLPWD
jgi:hypothetical protein